MTTTKQKTESAEIKAARGRVSDAAARIHEFSVTGSRYVSPHLSDRLVAAQGRTRPTSGREKYQFGRLTTRLNDPRPHMRSGVRLLFAFTRYAL